MKKFGIVVLVLFSLCFQGIAQSFMQYNALPSTLLKQPDSLVRFLVKNETSDKNKAIIIHDFLIMHYNLSIIQSVSVQKTNCADLLLKKEISAPDLSEVYTFLCRKAGIKAFTIEGYTPDLFYKSGQTFTVCNNSWNALHFDNTFLLTDIARDCGYFALKHSLFDFICKSKKIVFVKKPSHSFLLQLPDSVVYYNLSAFPYWQMVPCEIPLSVFESGSEAITFEFSRMGSIPCYNLNDSVSKETRISPIEKEYMQALNAIQFNPKNSLILALTIMRDATAQMTQLSPSDSLFKQTLIGKWAFAKSLLGQQKDALVVQQQNISKSFRLFDSITRGVLKSFIKENEKIISMNNSYIERNIHENKSLKLENKELALVNDNLKKESIDDVKRTKKKNTQEELTNIRDNLKILKVNKGIISSNKSYIADLRRSNDEERQLFINKNFDSIICKHDVNNTLFEQVISFRKYYPFQSDNALILYLNKIKTNKLEEKKIRKQTKDEGLLYVKNNSSLIDSIYKVNKTLIKDNKRIIKRNKRLSAEDNNETQLFAEANKAFLDDNNTMLLTNNSKLNDNKTDNVFMQNEIKQVKRELKSIHKINKHEQRISTIGIDYKTKSIESLNSSLTELIVLCAKQITTLQLK